MDSTQLTQKLFDTLPQKINPIHIAALNSTGLRTYFQQYFTKQLTAKGISFLEISSMDISTNKYQDPAEIQKLKDYIQNYSKSYFVFIMYAEGSNYDDFNKLVEKIVLLQKYTQTQIRILIVLTVNDLIESGIYSKKVNNMNLLILDQLSKNDYKQIFDANCARFENDLPNHFDSIYAVSFGNLGILKEIFINFNSKNIDKLNINELLKIPSLNDRLNKIINEINLIKKTNNEFSLNYLNYKKEKYTSPIWQYILSKTVNIQQSNLKEVLSPTENTLFQIFINNPGAEIKTMTLLDLVEKENISIQSLWSLYKHINNLNKKLTLNNINYKITSNKRGGYKISQLN